MPWLTVKLIYVNSCGINFAGKNCLIKYYMVSLSSSDEVLKTNSNWISRPNKFFIFRNGGFLVRGLSIKDSQIVFQETMTVKQRSQWVLSKIQLSHGPHVRPSPIKATMRRFKSGNLFSLNDLLNRTSRLTVDSRSITNIEKKFINLFSVWRKLELRLEWLRCAIRHNWTYERMKRVS